MTISRHLRQLVFANFEFFQSQIASSRTARRKMPPLLSELSRNMAVHSKILQNYSAKFGLFSVKHTVVMVDTHEIQRSHCVHCELFRGGIRTTTETTFVISVISEKTRQICGVCLHHF